VRVAVPDEACDRIRERVGRAHRITRREAHTGDVAVGDRGAAIGREHPLLVGTPRERIEGVAVGAVGHCPQPVGNLSPGSVRSGRQRHE
jgi:hypothetical protein